MATDSTDSLRKPRQRLSSATETTSDDAPPEDLNAAKSIIDNLTRQLKVHDDVTANLNILQKRIEHTHKRNQDAIQTLEDRLDEVESTWLKRLESQHNHWVDEYDQLAKAIENTPRILSDTDRKRKSRRWNSKLIGLKERSANIDEGISELKAVAGSRRRIERNLGDDKKRIRDIDARLKVLTMKERTLNTELTNQLKAQLRNPFTELIDDQGNCEFYGVCEITHSYEETINSLSEALQALERVGRTSATVNVAKGTKLENTPSADEIDEITIVMKRFLAKLRVQLVSAHFSGSPSRSPPVKTGIEKSPTKEKQPSTTDIKKDEKVVAPTSETLSSMLSHSLPIPEDKKTSGSSSDTTPLDTPRESTVAANIEKPAGNDDGEGCEDSGEEEKRAPQKSKVQTAKPK